MICLAGLLFTTNFSSFLERIVQFGSNHRHIDRLLVNLLNMLNCVFVNTYNDFSSPAVLGLTVLKFLYHSSLSLLEVTICSVAISHGTF